MRDFPLSGPPHRLDAVRAWYAADRAGTPQVAPPVRGASTVLLVREGARGPEVVMLHRAATMVFAGSYHAFPGGAVDEADGGRPLDAALVERVAGEMSVPPSLASAHLVAAVREVEEECGVRLDPALLRPRARWVTPAFEPRRYDTWILAAPYAGEVRSTSTEAQTLDWVSAGEVLDRADTGAVMLLPPTRVSLEALRDAGSATAYLSAPADPTAVQPVLTEVDGTLVMRVTT